MSSYTRQHRWDTRGDGHPLSRRDLVSALLPSSATGALIWGSAARSLGQDPGFPPREAKARILLDTDAANYFDDQFALAYAALSTEAIQIEAVYAAPFVNKRVSAPEEGMERSYEEIGRVLDALRIGRRLPVVKGAARWMGGSGQPVKSPAAEDIVERVMSDKSDIRYIVAIGAPTNVASALLLEPKLAGRTTIVWLGGTPHHYPSAVEFNLKQDPAAVRVLFDAGARLMHLPAPGLAENLRTNREELERRLRGRSAIGNYLLGRVEELGSGEQVSEGASRTLAIWDMAPVAWLANAQWVQSTLVPSPLLSDDLAWLHSPYRHRIRVAIRILRDAVFTDFFRKASSAPQ